MSLFQKTVIDNYLSKVKDEDFDTNWNTFKDYYLKEDTQERIKSKKEEEFQHDFLEFIFDNCLGYNIKDSADQNLFKEVKNVTDSKKADGAIKQGEDIVAVIELKSTKTKDFNEIQKQAFGYKNNHPNCRYVVSSNFQKLRFYIDDATKFEEFDLFKLSKEDFKLLWVCLAKDNLFDGVAKKLKSESILEEESITKKLYKDYSEFRKEIFNNLVESNPEIDKLTLFKKTQKLLDRFLFIFFAEDRGLVPTNSISKIIDQWEDSFTGSDSLYTVFKQYFKLLNEGKPKRGDKEAIYAYNGGLFADDEVLNTIKIDDDLLFKHTKNLSHYDFRSEISVDILGHIFEHSLSEIEEIQKEISGEEVEQSKRKKDGIFYTPAYITKYMVENTVGKLCDEKKKELEINEENYSDPKRRTKVRIENLDSYREWLLDLKICDPACGSGAFLNQALNFLIDEHNYIDDLKNSYLGGSIPFSDIENSILENNLYGVDINEESVEIAKLSLWLRTAQKERKLTSLSNNIKCGNSLIDEPVNEKDGYFKWEIEFPNVFENGGFDIIIGNPPYIRKQGLVEHYPELCDYYERMFVSATSNYDLYTLFMEKSYDLINNKGIVSLILPHKFLISNFGVGIRKFLKEKTFVESLVHFGSEIVFKDASTYTCILNLTKSNKENLRFKKIKPDHLSKSFEWDSISYDNLTSDNWDLQSQKVFDVIEKLKLQPYTIKDVFDKVFVGMQTSLDSVYVFEGTISGDLIKAYNAKYNYTFEIENELVKPILGGKDVFKYHLNSNPKFVLFPYNKDGTPVSEDYIKNNLPKTYSYLKHFEDEIRGREKGKMDIKEGWYLYIYQKNHEKFPHPKIMTREISLGCNMTYDENGDYYHNTKVYSFIKNEKFNTDDKYYLGILNSKVMWFFMKNTGSEYGGGYYVFKTSYLNPFPIPKASDDSEIIIEKVNDILASNKELEKRSNRFQKTIQRKFELDKLSNKLRDWYLLSFNDFVKELNKKKIKLSLSEESEWEYFFGQESKKALEILNSINKVDQEIDRMVYDLYELTKEEIEIVENS